MSSVVCDTRVTRMPCAVAKFHSPPHGPQRRAQSKDIAWLLQLKQVLTEPKPVALYQQPKQEAATRAPEGGSCSRPPRAVLVIMIQVPRKSHAAVSRNWVHCASLPAVSTSALTKVSQQASQIPVLVCSNLPPSVRVSAFSHAMHCSVWSTLGTRRCACKTFFKFSSIGSSSATNPGRAMATAWQSTTTHHAWGHEQAEYMRVRSIDRHVHCDAPACTESLCKSSQCL